MTVSDIKIYVLTEAKKMQKEDVLRHVQFPNKYCFN